MKLEVLSNQNVPYAVKVTGISNESQSEIVQFVADNARADYENQEFGSVIEIKSNLEAFIKEWNA